MFTGLVESLGVVTGLEPGGEDLRVTVKTPAFHADLPAIGDSISINGCCLTIVELQGETQFAFEAGAETLSKTNLGKLRVGSNVNLERALPANGRLGGHFVQGHVDGTGKVSVVEQDGEWTTMWFELNASLAGQLVPKGSITVDGVSLTVVNVTHSSFSVALIPHTLQATTLGQRAVGDVVNIETDILGKYVRQFMTHSAETPDSEANQQTQ